VIDEGELRHRFPEIPWDQPVPVTIAGLEHIKIWACRYCIAMHGLKAQDVVQGRAPEWVYHSRDEGLVHVENMHHD
jgi:hypothetical protein